MELRELKINIWKNWRSGKKKNDEEKGKNITLEDSRLEKLEEILEKMRAETQKRKDVKLEEEKRREKLLAENKLRQEKMLRQEQENRDRVAKKKMLEERWEMARWISTYISENEERWAKEKKEREQNEKKWREDWAKMTRFEKIREIKESEMPRMKLKLKLQPEKLCLPDNKPTPSQATHPMKK